MLTALDSKASGHYLVVVVVAVAKNAESRLKSCHLHPSRAPRVYP